MDSDIVKEAADRMEKAADLMKEATAAINQYKIDAVKLADLVKEAYEEGLNDAPMDYVCDARMADYWSKSEAKVELAKIEDGPYE